MDGPAARRDLERLLVEESPDALVVLSPAGDVRLWNGVAESIFGYAEQEALGRPLAELVVPDDRVEEELALRRRAQQADVFTRAAMRRHKDGRIVYIDLSMRAVRGTADEPGCYVCSMKDVTALKVERDAQLIQQRYGDLLESVPDAIVIINEAGRIVLSNAQAERMFGWGADEMIGQSVEALLPERYRGAHLGHRMRFNRAPQQRSMGAGLELNGLHRGGHEFPVEISLSPLRSDEGQLVMSAIRDITERRQAEVKLQQMNAELRVANQAKDRFLATMSHELRTPLNAILGFTGIMLMRLPGELTTDQETQLNIVKSSADHLLSLINDLLDLAKIQAGMLQLLPEEVDVHALLQEVHASLAPLAQAKSVRFELKLQEPSLSLLIDRRALRQIVINLANNAIKFTDQQGHVQLAARINGKCAEIEVADDGVGISTEDQQKLFAAFTQVGDPRRRPEGTGMGLHVCASLAKLLGGRIELDSTPQQGSRFTLMLEMI